MPLAHPNLVKKLVKSGLTDNEAALYVALLELGGAYPSKLASYTGLKRTTVYNTLLKLSIQGLVNEIEKRSKQFYQPEKPHKVLRLVKGRQRRAHEAVDQVEATLPQLEGLYGSLGTRPQVTYYEGIDEIKEVFERMYDADTIYGLADTKKLFEVIGADFFDTWRAQLKKKHIKLKDILTANSAQKPTEDVANQLKDLFSHQILPEKYANIGTDILVWGDNVALISLATPPTATIIQNKDIALTLRIMHEIIWKALESGKN